MPDPLTVTTAIALASKCIGGVTKVVKSGREIEDAMGHLSRWFECVSDINAAERRNKNPSIFKKLTNNRSIEAEAFSIWRAKQAVASQRKQLYEVITYTYGKEKWLELLDTERAVRKERKRLIHKRAEFRQNTIDFIAITFFCLFVIGMITGAIWLFNQGG